MALYDLTLPLDENTAVFPGDPPIRIQVIGDLSSGAPFSSRLLEMGSHAGTHADAPAHVFANAMTIDRVPLDCWVGPAILIDCADLDFTELSGQERLLVRNCRRGISAAQARHIAHNGLRLLGIDGESIDAPQRTDLVAHRILLSAHTVIVENLNLEGVPTGPGRLYCLPLRITGGDAAPCRVLWETASCSTAGPSLFRRKPGETR